MKKNDALAVVNRYEKQLKIDEGKLAELKTVRARLSEKGQSREITEQLLRAQEKITVLESRILKHRSVINHFKGPVSARKKVNCCLFVK